MSINPFPALREAWQEVKREFSDLPHEQKPPHVRLAQESADAIDDLRRSFKRVKNERKRLRDRSQ